MFFNIIRSGEHILIYDIVIIYEIERAVKLAKGKSRKVFAEFTAGRGIINQLDIIYERLNTIIDNCEVTALKNLPASSYGKHFGVSLVIGL